MTTMNISVPKRSASDAFGHYAMAFHQPSPFDIPFFQQPDTYSPQSGQVSLPLTASQWPESGHFVFADQNKKQKRDYELELASPLADDPLSNSSSFTRSVPIADPAWGPGAHPHLPIEPHPSLSQHVTGIPQQGLKFDNHPFMEIAGLRHKGLRERKPVQDSTSSYIKLPTAIKAQLEKAASNIPKHADRHVSRSALRPLRARESGTTVQRISPKIPLSPPDFGSAQRLDNMDKSLRNFYVNCMCPGRTLLPATNGWLKELLPMSDSDLVMHHALLAFSAGYCLEYLPYEKLLLRANEHYKRASELLMERLALGIVTGHEDAVVGALRLMWCDDIVQWELRRPKSETPRWYEAAQLAKQIMRTTDTGYRYWQSEKRQCTAARVSNANMLALIDILAGTVSPLQPEDEHTTPPHPWLLAGDARDASRVHGGTGLSPKLLHMIAQITHICAVMSHDPASTIMPLAARNMEERLLHLTQWSELSPGSFGCHVTTASLLHKCETDNKGLAATDISVTDLTAQAWLEAARLYLRFRFYRLPRQHTDIQEPFQALREILRRLPCSGKLFTSQSPFYPVFLYGLAAVSETDRKIARHWFETIVERATSRSSVPPVWRVLQRAWKTLDTDPDFVADPDVDLKTIGDRQPWWELLAERWKDEEGLLCIV